MTCPACKEKPEITQINREWQGHFCELTRKWMRRHPNGIWDIYPEGR